MALDFPNAPTIGQTFTAPDGTVWTWDGVKWVGGASASGLITAQQIDYDTLRLTAVGTKLKALGPISQLRNWPNTATTNPALDAAHNLFTGTGNAVWNLPPVVVGMCLTIMVGGSSNTTTIVPAGGDQILCPGASPVGAYTNAAPLIIPTSIGLTNQSITLDGIGGTSPPFWVARPSPAIAEALGWTARPYFCAELDNGGVNFNPPNGTWNQINFDNVVYDSHGWFSRSPNWYYQPKRKGVYRASWSLTAGDIATGQTTAVGASITVNGTNLVTRFTSWNGTNYMPNQNVLFCENLIALNGVSDFLQAQVYVQATTPIFVVGQNMFMVEYKGPL